MKRIPQQELMTRLMDQGDVEGVTASLLELTADRRPVLREAAFKNLRAKIARSGKWIKQEGLQAIRDMSTRQDIPQADREFLTKLLKFPVWRIHGAKQSKFLSTASLQEEFNDIRIFLDPFYDLVCPYELKQEATEDKVKTVEDHNMHKRKKRETYIMTPDEVAACVAKAKNYIAQDLDWTKSANSARLIEAICILTGRRKSEIHTTLQLKSVPDQAFQADIRGVAKQKIAAALNEQWKRVPLLIPFDDLVKAVINARRFPWTGRACCNTYKSIWPAGRKLTHTHFRNIFSETAYAERHTVNKFYIGDNSCGHLQWRALALCVNIGICGSHYSAMCLDEPINDDDDQHADEEVAGEPVRPRKRLCQDPL